MAMKVQGGRMVPLKTQRDLILLKSKRDAVINAVFDYERTAGSTGQINTDARMLFKRLYDTIKAMEAIEKTYS
jgi:hypothetical protein